MLSLDLRNVMFSSAVFGLVACFPAVETEIVFYSLLSFFIDKLTSRFIKVVLRLKLSSVPKVLAFLLDLVQVHRHRSSIEWLSMAGGI